MFNIFLGLLMKKTVIMAVLIGAASTFVGQWAYAQYLKRTPSA
jgi:hypothetical protein